MKRFIGILLLYTALASCSDGDLIITTFNFEDAELKTCGDVGNYVFYKENTLVFESLSLKLGTTDSLYKTEGTKIYQLGGTTNFVNYRSYDGALGSNYFCSSIPPTSPTVISDYLAVSGSVQVIVTFIYDNPVPRPAAGIAFIPNSDQNQNSLPNFPQRSTVRKNVQIILKDIVLVSGENQITQETLDMGTIENVRTEEIIP